MFSSFLASLHWPQGNPDFGKFSYFELLLMFEIYAGHRLHAEKAIRPHLRPRRPLVFSGFSFGIGQEIRHGCQFLQSLFRALGHLPGGLVRFIPCQPGAHSEPNGTVVAQQRAVNDLVQGRKRAATVGSRLSSHRLHRGICWRCTRETSNTWSMDCNWGISVVCSSGPRETAAAPQKGCRRP